MVNMALEINEIVEKNINCLLFVINLINRGRRIRSNENITKVDTFS